MPNLIRLPAASSSDAWTRGQRVWLISDGHAGTEVPAIGIARALGLDYTIKRVAPRLPWRLFAPWGPADPTAWIGRPDSQFSPPWPHLAIAKGRQSIPFLRALRKAAGPEIFTVILQDPRIGLQAADLIWVPAHDELTGPNVVTTITSPHLLSQTRLRTLRSRPPADIAALPYPRITVVLGGPNAVYSYGPACRLRLALALRSLAKLGGGLMITPSRRTTPDILDTALKATRSCPRIVWEGGSTNRYAEFLAHADFVVVTADSVNMTSEACATGRPVYVFEPDGGSKKFRSFHRGLRAYGATRVLPAKLDALASWSYDSIDSTPVIAREIKRRWRVHAGRCATELASA